eukprot:CAMPEP_0201092834 /NCGR_PEP_ID=MMETSP0812-20130820/1366_1 /ASSEMBLY_ACC=CAM_ASM_000668 /TAXON_ID=98059 /ORGANISM="Dinobryon sp., Strain UTEXLB2267" /LENGTH=627 /DNA_ID=CAMNT_0047344629 /DNA_START=193 /DNA_END=2076 /DNA_ORIENTATION=-
MITLEQYQALSSEELNALIKDANLSRPNAGQARLYYSARKFQSVLGATKLIDLQQLSKPNEVSIPMEENAPPYLTDKWLQDTVTSIEKNYYARDTLALRVPPAALVRCSRGGKTRALLELSTALKDRFKGEDVAVIYISINANTSLLEWETLNPIDAICRRIAFAALPNSEGQSFEKFAEEVEVPSSAILEWLGNTPRILLIDELNSFKDLNNPENIQMQKLGAFLKENFLTAAKQYFVFSSHVISSSNQLSEFMDFTSKRNVLICELPLIANVSIAIKNFQFPVLDVGQLLFYGCVPALVYESSLDPSSEKKYLPNANRQLAIDTCVKDGLTERSIEQLLGTFLDGDPSLVPSPLLKLMDTTRDGKILWIPYNMVAALSDFSNKGPIKYSKLLRTICNCFDNFKTSSGDAWENLFVITLLIRLISHRFDRRLLPLDEDVYADYEVSFNKYIMYDTGESLSAYINVDEFIRAFTTPEDFPHIAVYFPTHAQFETFDVIVAACDKRGKRTLYGYQLKQGAGDVTPLNPFLKRDWLRDKWFHRIYAVRGKAPSKSSEITGDWIIPNEPEINAFFGMSGQRWTPRRWAELDRQPRRQTKSKPSAAADDVVEEASATPKMVTGGKKGRPKK